MSQTILIVDDEADIRNILRDILEDEGYDVVTAAHSEDAFQQIATHKPSLAILDIWLENSERDGMEILDMIVKDHKHMNVLMISGHGNIETAVKAIQAGAYDFIEKPFKIDRLVHTVERALQISQIAEENRDLKIKVNAQNHRLDGKSQAVTALIKKIDMLAETQSRVMITGPRGSGKSSIAALLKQKSKRNDTHYQTIDCGNLRVDDIQQWRDMRDGFLTLDHVQNMPAACQNACNALLRDGARLPRLVSIRDGDFDDAFSPYLGQQLSVETLHVPDLSQRIDDMPELVKNFIAHACHHHSRAQLIIDPAFTQAVIAADWPGNTGQLKLACQWAVEMALNDNETTVKPQHLPQNGEKGGELAFINKALKEARDDFERHYLDHHYKLHSGNITKMAEAIGMDRASLHRKIKTLEIKATTVDTVSDKHDEG